MKVALVVAVVLLLVVAGSFWALSQNRNKEHSTASNQQSPNPMLELRNRVLSWPASEIGLSNPSPPPAVWASVMELDFGDISVSVIALEDGNASLYFSNGGGIIGGYAHDGVRNAVQEFIQAASSCAKQLDETQEFPLPTDGQVSFYMRQGLLTLVSSVSESDVQQTEHPLHGLYVAGHNVITELRITEEGNGGQA